MLALVLLLGQAGIPACVLAWTHACASEQLRSHPAQVLPAATKMESADALAAAKKDSGKCRGGDCVGLGREHGGIPPGSPAPTSFATAMVKPRTLPTCKCRGAGRGLPGQGEGRQL